MGGIFINCYYLLWGVFSYYGWVFFPLWGGIFRIMWGIFILFSYFSIFDVYYVFISLIIAGSPIHVPESSQVSSQASSQVSSQASSQDDFTIIDQGSCIYPTSKEVVQGEQDCSI